MFIKAKSLTVRIYLSFLVLVICCMIGAGGLAYLSAYHMLLDDAYVNADNLMAQISNQANAKLAAINSVFDSLAETQEIQRLLLNRYTTRSAYYADLKAVTEHMQRQKSQEVHMLDAIYFYAASPDLELYTANFTPVTVIPSRSEVAAWVWSKHKENKTWIRSIEGSLFSSTQPRDTLSLFSVWGQPERPVFGTLLYEIKTSYFQDCVETTALGEHGYLAMAGDGWMIHSSGAQAAYLVDEERLNDPSLLNGQQTWIEETTSSGKKMLLQCMPLSYGDSRLIAIISRDDIIHKAQSVFFPYLAVGAGLILLGIFLAGMTARNAVHPIRQLVNRIDQIDYANLPERLDISMTGEMGVLVQCLDRLLVEVKKLMQSLREKERQRRRLELSIVQAQINPHFLYNTLGSVKGLVEEGRNDEATHLTDMLIRFYRTGLGRGRTMVSLEEEFGHVQSYLEVERMRYPNKFSYEIDLPENVKNAQIMKLSVQPLVENAIYHGLKEKAGEGVVLVSAHQQDGMLKIHVLDDGLGIPEDRLRQITEEMDRAFEAEEAEAGASSGSMYTYGLRNVHQRILLKYDGIAGVGLKIRSAEDVFTEVVMTMPLIVVGEDENDQTAHRG